MRRIRSPRLNQTAARLHIERRDTAQSHQEFLTRLAQASDIESPGVRTGAPQLQAMQEEANDDSQHPHDLNAQITKMNDSQTRTSPHMAGVCY